MVTSPKIVTPEQRRIFVDAIDAYNSAESQRRFRADVLLNQLPRSVQVALALEAVDSISNKRTSAKRFRNLRVAAMLMALAYGFWSIVSFILHSQVFSEIFPIFILGPVLLSCTMDRAIFSRNSRETGVFHALVAIDSVELVPALIDALRWQFLLDLPQDEREVLQNRIREKLAKLMPDYAIADMPPLTRRHQANLLEEISQFATRSRALGIDDWRLEYMVALLKILDPDPDVNKQATYLLRSVEQDWNAHPGVGVVLGPVIEETVIRLRGTR